MRATKAGEAAPQLTPAGPDLWRCAVPYRVLGANSGRQLVAVRLPDGGLWIHSPVPMSSDLRAALVALGEVRHVVAPSRWHDECLVEFQAEFPEAEFHATPGLAAARRDVRFAHELSDTPHPDWAPVIGQHLIRGMPRMNEVVFLHRPSRSLLIADLAFNLRPEGDWWTALLFRLAGACGRLTPSRACRGMMRDRAAVRASLEHVLTWDFDRLVVGHGHNIETGGRAALREAFSFLW